MRTASEVLGPGGPFTRLIPDFAPRTQQQEMAEAVAEAIQEYSVLVCEAGTGTGKTLAYLVPALLSGKKVIISTGTKNLQEQLFHRDLPLVRRALGLAIQAALLKGRANYLCLHRLDSGDAHGLYRAAALGEDLGRVRQWSGATKTGDISELADVSEQAPVWRQVTSTADNCLGQECPRYGDCFVLKARRAALEADLVVINHHLFFADMALREEGFGELLPGADAVVLDEAHQLPAIAHRFFGQSVSSRQLQELGRDVDAAYFLEAGDLPEVPQTVHALDRAVADLRLALDGGPQRGAWHDRAGDPEVRSAYGTVQQALARLAELLSVLADRTKDLQSCHRRCLDLAARLDWFDQSSDESQVRWLELMPRGFLLHMTPLDVGCTFEAQMSSHMRAWVFTSATLAVGERFDHFARRLGLKERRERQWESPFDFRAQALCYLPQNLPDPRHPDYDAAVARLTLEVLKASRGRAFVLFTSHRALQHTAAHLEGVLEFPLLVQGRAPRSALVTQFSRRRHAVLLGTSSFWEGVDVRGDALSCVIIDKLPFAAPDDPVLRARHSMLREQGRDPFQSDQLPQAVIALKQGAGRLIRDVSDSGVLVLCDPRLQTRSYGKVFLKSLPAMRRTRDLQDVRRFFDDREAQSAANER